MSDFLQNCDGIAAILVGGFYGYGLYQDRKNGNKIDTVKIFKDQIDGMELKMKTQEADIIKLTGIVQELKLAIELRDKKFAEAILTLQGHDPVMTDFIKAGNEFMVIALPHLERLGHFLDKQSF